jgi:hypothetical protein
MVLYFSFLFVGGFLSLRQGGQHGQVLVKPKSWFADDLLPGVSLRDGEQREESSSLLSLLIKDTIKLNDGSIPIT